MHFRNGGYASTYFYLLSILTVYLFKQFVNRQRYLLAVQLQGVRSVHRRNIHAVFFYIRSQILQLSSFCDGILIFMKSNPKGPISMVVRIICRLKAVSEKFPDVYKRQLSYAVFPAR